MRLGPVLVDVAGLELTPDDIERLQHPQVGGVILFARNFAAPLQLIQLAHSIRELRSPQLLICADHEGGRVQRFRHGFTAIPPMRALGTLWDRDPAQAIAAARGCGFVIGSELQAHGVDFSFTPVLVDASASISPATAMCAPIRTTRCPSTTARSPRSRTATSCRSNAWRARAWAA